MKIEIKPPLSARDIERLDWIRTECEKALALRIWPGSIEPLYVLNGHMNGRLWATVTGADIARIKALFADDDLIGPGYRIGVRIGDDTWGLHIENVSVQPDTMSWQAHIDCGDPDNNILGVFAHVGEDFIEGHFDSDLDPKGSPA